jgi:ribosomal-protein-alanine N-acetyltransferase
LKVRHSWARAVYAGYDSADYPNAPPHDSGGQPGLAYGRAAQAAVLFGPAGGRAAPRLAAQYFLDQLTAGGRTAAGWYSWYALRKAEDEVPRTLVGAGGFMGPPTADGTAEISYSVATGWRGQGLGTELVGGLVQQAAATGMVYRLVAHARADNPASQQVLLHNGFVLVGPGPDGYLRFERAVEPAADPRLQDVN